MPAITASMVGALRAKLAASQPAVIAEIKKASPSKGVIRPDFRPAEIAASYEAGGAACLSVLTDREFFQGAPQYLAAARKACALPALRKDFMVHELQVYEARVWQADCILLIAACLDDAQMADLEATALALGLDVLVEVHDGAELARALRLAPTIIGINNRDLLQLEKDPGDVRVTEALAPLVPKSIVVLSESSLLTPQDVQRALAAGAHAALVGTALLQHANPAARLRELAGSGHSL